MVSGATEITKQARKGVTDAEGNFDGVVMGAFSGEETFELRPGQEPIRRRVLERRSCVAGRTRAKVLRRV